MIKRIIMIFQTNTEYTFRINHNDFNCQAKLNAWYTDGIIFNTDLIGRIGIYDNQITDVRNDYINKCITIDIENFEKR